MINSAKISSACDYLLWMQLFEMQMLCTSVGRNMGSCRNTKHLCKADILILIPDSWSDSGSCWMSPNSNSVKKTIKQIWRKQAVTADTRLSTRPVKDPRRSGMRHSLSADWFVRLLDTIPAANAVIHRKKMAASSIHHYWKWSRFSCCSPTDETTNSSSLSCVFLCFSKLPTVLLSIIHFHV